MAVLEKARDLRNSSRQQIIPQARLSQRVQISQQVFNVLRAQSLAVCRHFVAAQADDVGHALIVGRQSTQRQIFVLKDSLEARAFLASSGIGLMAAVAAGIVDLAASRLLGVESKLFPIQVLRNYRLSASALWDLSIASIISADRTTRGMERQFNHDRAKRSVSVLTVRGIADDTTHAPNFVAMLSFRIVPDEICFSMEPRDPCA